MNGSLPYDFSCAPEAIQGLAPVVRSSLNEVAVAYATATGQRLRVTSARRTLRHCAELMASFSVEQLEGMYCRHGYPDYIRQIVAQREKLGRDLTTQETYLLLQNRTEGYISAHLFGAAVDIATASLADRCLLEQLLQKAGFTTLDESSLGVHCIHASHTGIPREIVRE